MSSYKLSLAAEDDLIRIYLYGVGRFGFRQAQIYYEQFFNYFELIAKNPEAFERVDYIKPGYFRCKCGVDSIFYKIDKDHVFIVAILGRQDIHKIL